MFGFSAAEVGEALHAAPDAIHSILQRAHKAVETRLPEQSQQATLRSLGDERLQGIVEGYVKAWESGDVAAILAMLTEDAALAMPPRTSWYRGHEAIGAFLAGWPLGGGRRWRLTPTRANGQPAFSVYGSNEEQGGYLAHGAQVLTLAGDGRIREITAFLSTGERWIHGGTRISSRNGDSRRRKAIGDPWTPAHSEPRDG